MWRSRSGQQGHHVNKYVWVDVMPSDEEVKLRPAAP
jgi:hypothetical protein